MLIKVRVKPNSGRHEVIEINEGNYSVYLKKEARKGKANIELINLLAKYFRTSVCNIKIKGKTSRDKLVEVKG